MASKSLWSILNAHDVGGNGRYTCVILSVRDIVTRMLTTHIAVVDFFFSRGGGGGGGEAAKV